MYEEQITISKCKNGYIVNMPFKQPSQEEIFKRQQEIFKQQARIIKDTFKPGEDDVLERIRREQEEEYKNIQNMPDITDGVYYDPYPGQSNTYIFTEFDDVLDFLKAEHEE